MSKSGPIIAARGNCVPSPITPKAAADVRQRLISMAARRGAPGVQYLVSRDGETLLEHCLGLADAALALPVTPLTTFNAYSITKTLTAAAVILLAEEGRLDLEAPIGVAAGVQGLEAYGTVRDTLLHRAGFRNPNPLRWIHAAAAHPAFQEAAFVAGQVATLRGTQRRRSSSGYSNVGYLLLGLTIENVCQRPFVRALDDLVIQPLGLRTDQRLAFAIAQPDLHAHGHLRRYGLLHCLLALFADRATIVQGVEGRWVRLQLHQVNGSAYGGLIANARGIARFGQAVLAGRAGIPPKVCDRLLDPVPGPGPARSVGWFSGKLRSLRWFAHAGGGLGYYGELRLYPDLRTVSCVLTNGPGLANALCLDDIDVAWLEAA